MPTMLTPDRQALLERFDRIRERSNLLFSLADDEAYFSAPIPMRHPIVFYEGHFTAFALNTLVRRALGQRGLDEELDRLFARGIDPEEVPDARGFRWPDRACVAAYAAEAAARVREALSREDLDRPGHPLLDHANAVYAVLEHEEMHHETLQYILHRLPAASKRRPSGYRPRTEGVTPAPARVRIPGGAVTLGAGSDEIAFGWDNEFPATRVPVEPFGIDVHNVTNAAYLAFVEEGGYDRREWWADEDWRWRTDAAVEHPLFWERHDGRWYWRAMFDLIPLPESWPAYVTLAEAAAFARSRGGRLASEAEYHRAAFGTADGAERPWPWGTASPDGSQGNFGHGFWDPVPVGSYPSSASAFGVHDLVGNGWEWTSTPFRPFPGFRPGASYPEYSADFFDDRHFVMKGASPATASALVRRSYRTWFRPHYPYVYATFRCVYD